MGFRDYLDDGKMDTLFLLGVLLMLRILPDLGVLEYQNSYGIRYLKLWRIFSMHGSSEG